MRLVALSVHGTRSCGRCVDLGAAAGRRLMCSELYLQAVFALPLARPVCRAFMVRRATPSWLHALSQARELPSNLLLPVHRKKRFQAQVGDGLLSLHQAGTPHGLPPTARYWHFLCKHAFGLDHVRWWQEGSESLQNKAEEVSCFSFCAFSVVHSALHKHTEL